MPDRRATRPWLTVDQCRLMGAVLLEVTKAGDPNSLTILRRAMTQLGLDWHLGEKMARDSLLTAMERLQGAAQQAATARKDVA